MDWNKDSEETLVRNFINTVEEINGHKLGATTFSIMALSITTLSIMGLVPTLSIDIQHNSIECHYPECRDYLNVMLSAIMLSAIILSAIMLNVVMLSVVRMNVVMLSVIAPQIDQQIFCNQWLINLLTLPYKKVFKNKLEWQTFFILIWWVNKFNITYEFCQISNQTKYIRGFMMNWKKLQLAKMIHFYFLVISWNYLYLGWYFQAR